jgi:hypothetical protein
VVGPEQVGAQAAAGGVRLSHYRYRPRSDAQRCLPRSCSSSAGLLGRHTR